MLLYLHCFYFAMVEHMLFSSEYFFSYKLHIHFLWSVFSTGVFIAFVNQKYICDVWKYFLWFVFLLFFLQTFIIFILTKIPAFQDSFWIPFTIRKAFSTRRTIKTFKSSTPSVVFIFLYLDLWSTWNLFWYKEEGRDASFFFQLSLQCVPNAPFAPLRLQFHLPPGYLPDLPLLLTSLIPSSAPTLGSLLLASYCNCFPESCLLYPLLTPQPPEELSPMPIVTLPCTCANNLQI